MAKKLNLLVTGLSGVVGQALKPVLEERYNVSALSRSGVDGLPDGQVLKANIAEFDSIRPAFEGVDSVLNLAADGGTVMSARSHTVGSWRPGLKTSPSRGR